MIEKPPYFDNDDLASWKLMSSLQSSAQFRAIQNEYLYWDKVKYRGGDTDPIKLWYAVKMYRLVNKKEIAFGNYVFGFVLTDYIQESLHHFDLHLSGNLGSNIGIAETDRTKYMLSSITEEAISSSQMEGANTTRQKAKEMIQKELKPKTKSEQMIMNNFVTMRHIIRHKSDTLTPEALLHIHRLITKGTLDRPEEEGMFRAANDIFVVDQAHDEVVHTMPKQDELKQLIEALCLFFNNDEGDFIHSVIKGIIIHFMIGWIHPFTDGNGRTARALFYWYMLKKGYWLTEYLSISTTIKDTKVRYEKAYLHTELDDNDLSYFITYHLRTMEDAFESLKRYIGRKQREVMQAAKFVKIPGVNERMAQLLKMIHEDADRVFTPKEVENRFNISNFTARTDLRQLVALGFMEPVQVNKIKQTFVRSHQFEQLLSKYRL